MIFRIYFLYFTIIFVPYSVYSQTLDLEKKIPKVGLALSGGGAKGFAHLEVIETIEKAGIKIDYISGTSMGAIVGSLYASGYTPRQIKEIIQQVDFEELFIQERERKFIPLFDKSYQEKYIFALPIENFKISLPSAISKGQRPLLLLTDLLNKVHHIHDFSKLPIPFLCIATNMETGEEVQMETGFLPLSVLASAAYPSLIEPVKIGNKTLIDGGIVNNFPVEALRKKGMDIIIGIDLGSDLQKSENLNSIFKIINQIISFRINSKTDYERNHVDILIKPDLKNFTVTDFDKKDSILLKGKIAAENSFDKFKEVAYLQNYDTLNSPRLKENPLKRSIFITKLDIKSDNAINTKYIKRKVGINVPENITIQNLSKGISSLFSSGNFNRVYYEINNEKDSTQSLILHLNKKSNNSSLKFGIHYDDIYKTSLLANLTLNRLIKDNSSLSIDVVLGKNFRTNINYYLDNGIYPSFGSNLTINTFNFDYSDVKKCSIPFNKFNTINYQLYFQSNILEKYAIGLGLEYNYLEYKTYSQLLTEPFLIPEKNGSYFIDPYFYIKIDTQNDPNFPTHGFKFDAINKYIFLSNTDNFSNFYILKSKLSYSIPFTKRLFMENNGTLGVSFNKLPFEYKYYLGGYFKQNFLDFEPFTGLPFFFREADQMLSIYTSLNYKILKHHFLKIYTNYANLKDRFKDIQYFKFQYSSYGTGYGYQSPFGPINILYTYNTNQKKGILNIALGFWF